MHCSMLFPLSAGSPVQHMNLINEKAPGAIAKVPLENYAGKVIACDASMAMYQFMIATQFNHNRPHMLTDDGGNTTAHLIGLFHRTIQLLEQNIKPIWVFDGKPPAMKSVELERRKRIKADAREQLKGAAPVHKDLPQPVYPDPAPAEPKEPKKERAPQGMASKQSVYRKKYVGQVRDLEMEFALKHSNLIGKPFEPSLSCPDYCYIGESDEEAEGDARQLNAYFEAANKPGQTPEEIEDVRKYAQRSLRVTKEMAEDAKLLLTLMGVPVIVAPSEAEAQCAALVKAGKAYAVVSEDMDSLVFGSSLLQQPIRYWPSYRLQANPAVPHHRKHRRLRPNEWEKVGSSARLLLRSSSRVIRSPRRDNP